ncbi:release factor glutamine methyltransferase [Nematocida sp. AWRm77]|nr:release factor glutamine methyltransferase [Nematocida sp. AWRm77]
MNYKSEPLFYPPDEDTFLLEDALLGDSVPFSPKLVVEVGCGSGHISQMLRRLYPTAYVLSTDINPHAVQYTSASLELSNGEAIRTSFVTGIGARIDIAVFNPPYLPSSCLSSIDAWIDKSWAGGVNGMEVTSMFLEETKDVKLRYLLLCSLNNPEAVISSLSHYTVDVIKQKKILGEHLYVLRIHKC